ncbi:cation diffusion facilitator 1 [Aureobasidium pullulans]|uniref:Cation diffusion facilitator 1 n=1 Tax=Aureobasidium pullulans TaxID=5580 RepID=A0A4S9AMF4_AURPU|nr:cation diffusion facilitator 1 [Aureobasidium pullulans]
MSHHGSDPDLHRAISLRPSPFHNHPEPSTRIGQLPEGALPVPSLPQTKPGASTSYEVVESHDPVSRPAYARNASESGDVEGRPFPTYTDQDDPLDLSSRLKSAEQLNAIQANTSKKRQSAKDRLCAPVAQTKDAVQSRKIRGFYEGQNEAIERMLKSVEEHRREAKEEAGADHLQYKIAVYGSFAANVVLAGLQLYGAISSGSLSLFTSMSDALFDPCSTFLLILCNRAVNRVDPRKFPAGKARIETAGNICFCFLMCSVSFILIVMSARELATEPEAETKRFHLPAVLAVCIAFATKFALFLYCWSLRNKYSSIRILWEDHRNDLFINGFGVLASVGGSKLAWQIDPAGAIVLSCLISFLWLRTAYSEFQLLIGVTAPTHILQWITYISMTHSPDIVSLDTVRAWYSGPRITVEVDIVLHPEMTLKETHDIAEDLQNKLEGLPDVERAYVHSDYETEHRAEHFLKKEL